MSISAWKAILRDMELDTYAGVVSGASKSQLDEFEESTGLWLPASYRSYCQVFGPGTFNNDYTLHTPGANAKAYSLESINATARDRGHDGSSHDPAQIDRGIFFCDSLVLVLYFFDTKEVAKRRGHEAAVYSLRRTWEVKRVAESFDDFMERIVLSKTKGRNKKKPNVFVPVG